MHSLEQELEIEKSKLNFVGAITRELTSPFTIMSEVFPFIKQLAVPDDQKSYIAGLQIGIDQLTLIMENLVISMHIEKGTLTLNLQNTDITPIIKQTLADVTAQAQLKQITLNFEEPTEQIPFVIADQMIVRDILLNLIENALKFTPPGGTVIASSRQLDEEVFIQIQDTGPGIPKDAMPNLFTKFYTVPNTITESGTGLGLYICKSLVELHHGKIWTDSVEGKGSTFSFSLPMASGN
jgi:two-component system phosphate regulon sensor histidine kinase PhoR